MSQRKVISFARHESYKLPKERFGLHETLYHKTENRDPSQTLLTATAGRRVASLGRFIAVTMTNDGGGGGKCVMAL